MKREMTLVHVDPDDAVLGIPHTEGRVDTFLHLYPFRQLAGT